MLSLNRKLPGALSPKLLLPLLLQHHHLLPSPPPPSPSLKPSLNPNNSRNPIPATLLLFPKSFSSLIRGGCSPDDDIHLSPLPPTLCPGCGVHMQPTDPTLPGFFSPPSPKPPDYRAPLDRSRPIPLPALPRSLKSGEISAHDQQDERTTKPAVCARCHSLRHYGRVKNPSAENLLPDFDFERMVAPKMLSPSGPRSLVLLLVDAADFHGSFPQKLSKLLSASIDRNCTAWKEGKPGNVPRVLLVVTKCDVLPSSVSPERLEEWVRRQMHECGVSVRLTGVHLVSSVKDWGVRNLVEHVTELVGSRGNVWAVGAQNVGKSTLINAMGRCAAANGSRRIGQLTEAPVPGTTVGIVRVEGVLSGQAKLFDTPGILHPYQITTRLTREEQKLVHVGKELRPRTYRVKAGYSVHLGGLMRLDVEEASVESIYLTVWASPLLPLHMGRTENASRMIEEHFGRQLQPPVGESRVAELGKWTRKEFIVAGNRWDANSIDIAAAGLGWVAVGLKGEAVLGVWTYDGVDVVPRSSLVSERARIFEEAGFTVSKVVSQGDSAYNKLKHEEEKKKRNGKNSKFPQAAIKRERGVILREMQEVHEQMEEVIFDHLHMAAFRGHPLGDTILGPEENIRAIDKVDLQRYISAHYSGHRMVVSAAGAVKHYEIVDMISSMFKNFSRDPTTADQLVEANPAIFTGSMIRVENEDIPLVHLAIAFKGASWVDPNSIPLMVLQSLLGCWNRSIGVGNCSGSELARRLSTDDLAESLMAYNTNYHDTGLFGVYSTAPPDRVHQLLNVIMEELRRLAYQVSEEEVMRARNQLKSSLMLHIDGSGAVAENNGRQMLTYGRVIPFLEFFARIDAVDAETIMETARNFIINKDVAVAAVGPLRDLPDHSWFCSQTRAEQTRKL